MRILAIDTCNGFCSAAMLEDNNIIASSFESQVSKQAEMLPYHIQNTLSVAKANLADIDYIGVTIGPGSFTGVRIGVALANGIQIANNVNLLGVSCLQVLGYQAVVHKQKCFAVMDARRDEVFIQGFDLHLKPITEAMLLNFDEAEKIVTPDSILAGSGATHLTNLNNRFININLDAEETVKTAAYLISHNQIFPCSQLAPLYIRNWG
jgi:tRNA threonylcarbamoyladenosine biosynthesis protein TsaB